MKFGIHNPSWLFGTDPAGIFDAVKAKAHWAETHGFSWFSVMDHLIQIGNVGSEAFNFKANFGNETIEGFATGANPDTIQFALSSFSYLNPSMSQAQDLAAVLSHASSGTAGTTIPDSTGDSLTLAGVTSAMISANQAQFKFA